MILVFMNMYLNLNFKEYKNKFEYLVFLNIFYII